MGRELTVELTPLRFQLLMVRDDPGKATRRASDGSIHRMVAP